jgi:[acyl-carrier-protein] S-malonyltransferase
MGHDLLVSDAGTRALLAEAEERLAMPLGRLIREAPESELQATENAQPAIVFHSLALLRRLSDEGVRPQAVVGHSLGEFSGLVAAGGLEPLDALAAVRARGLAMAKAAPSGTGMAAVLGLDDDAVQAACEKVDGVVPANYNAPGQVVVSGSDAGLEAATPVLLSAGARRVLRLNVSAAFHSPFMQPAAEEFAATWNQVELKDLGLPQVFNADASAHQKATEVRELMVRQLTEAVRFTECVRELSELGIRRFVEVGPKRTLTALVKKIVPSADVENIEDMSGLAAFTSRVHA